MKHAGKTSLDSIEPLLAAARRIETLTERSRGIFYRGSIAFLHFHEDPAGMFADVKSTGGWKRMRVTTAAERAKFLVVLRGADATFKKR